jgi:hypothetical protein
MTFHPDPSDLAALKKRQWLRLRGLGRASAFLAAAVVTTLACMPLARAFSPDRDSAPFIYAFHQILGPLILFTPVAALIHFILALERYSNLVRKLIKARKSQRRSGRA